MKGFGGMPGNMQAMLKQAQKMQEQMLKTQAETESFTAEGSAGGGMVKVVASGKQEIISVAIQAEVVNPNDIEMLQDLVRAATNDALAKVKENLKTQMSKVTGGLNIPGLF